MGHEGGVGDVDHRVVDLEEEDLLDAALGHVGQGAGAVERGEGAAVAVGAHEDVPGLVEDDLALGVERRPHPLHEEEDVRAVKPEVVVGLEDGAGGRIVGLGGHDVEGHGRAVGLLQAQQLARVEPEERAVADRPDGVGALGAVVTQAGALAAGDEQRRHLAGAEELLALGMIDRLFVTLGGLHGGRFEGACGGGRLAGILQHGLHAADRREVERRDLREQGSLTGRVKLVPKAEHMALPIAFQNCLGLFERHG